MPITKTDDKINVTFTLPREAWENEGGIPDAFALSYGYQERVVSDNERDPTFDKETRTIANPISKAEFTLAKVQDYIDEIWTSKTEEISVAPAKKQIKAEIAKTRKAVRDNTVVEVS